MENQIQNTGINWLQRLKDESWEAELLVSAVAIFAILKSFSMLDWLIEFFIDNLTPELYGISYFIVVCGFLAIGILAAMFAIHFALRAYWIGLVGLNSVFPDYGLKDSAYSPIYTKKILTILPKVSKSISKIDELCSVIFSAAFALMLIYLYITITTSFLLLAYNKLKGLVPDWLLLIPFALFALFLILGTIIAIPANLKKFHHNERLQHLYFIFARWNAFLTYGPLNKSILQIGMLFASNFKKKKGLIKMVMFMLFVGIIFGGVKLSDSNYRYLLDYDYGQDITKAQSSFFADNNHYKDFLLAPEISSNLITKSATQLFIPIFESEIKILKNTCEIATSDNIANTSEEERTVIRNNYLQCYQNQHRIFLNDVAVQIDFLKSNHPRTDQYGISGFLNLENLKKGMHTILVQKNLSAEIKKEWRIQFYYGSEQ